MSIYVDEAMRLFSSGVNCAQSVSGAFAGLVGDKLSPDDLLGVSASFGGGFAATKGLCGCVSGAAMILGLLRGSKTADDKARFTAESVELVDQFRNKHGSIICQELSRRYGDTPPAEGYTRLSCADYVRNATEILENILRERGIIG